MYADQGLDAWSGGGRKAAGSLLTFTTSFARWR
jgi:hypothetical protein